MDPCGASGTLSGGQRTHNQGRRCIPQRLDTSSHADVQRLRALNSQHNESKHYHRPCIATYPDRRLGHRMACNTMVTGHIGESFRICKRHSGNGSISTPLKSSAFATVAFFPIIEPVVYPFQCYFEEQARYDLNSIVLNSAEMSPSTPSSAPIRVCIYNNAFRC